LNTFFSFLFTARFDLVNIGIGNIFMKYDFEALLISCLTPPSLPASDVGITNIFIKTGLIENWPASIGSSSTCLPVNDEDQEPYICTSPIKVCTI
jgi:hypothetical protein